jgi:hypothetical protein
MVAVAADYDTKIANQLLPVVLIRLLSAQQGLELWLVTMPQTAVAHLLSTPVLYLLGTELRG